MSIFDDILNTGKNIANETNSLITGSPQQSVPAAQANVGPAASATGWAAPDASGNGQFTVYRDALTMVAKRIQADLAELDSLVSQVKAASNDFGSLNGWPTGTSFSTNAANVAQTIAQKGTNAGTRQNTAAKTLNDNASHYETAEADSTQQVGRVSDQLQASGGSVSAASAIGQL